MERIMHIKDFYMYRFLGKRLNGEVVFSKVFAYNYRPSQQELQGDLQGYVLDEGAEYNAEMGLNYAWDGEVQKLEGVRIFEKHNS